MTLQDLLDRLPPVEAATPALPQGLLGAFRRKSITFCNGLTDETTVVYWFQSRSFTIDLRLPDGAATPLTDRQGWIGDTHWDPAARALSWTIARSYQPRNQWPEPASLAFIGNAIFEFAPSGAYVEDWRQQSTHGPLLGLRLISMTDEETGQVHAMDGGLIVAGEHIAFVQSRLPTVDHALRGTPSLESALAHALVTEADIASYEVSVAIDGEAVTHSTQPSRIGEAIATGDFDINDDGAVIMSRHNGKEQYRLHFVIDTCIRQIAFDAPSCATQSALDWLEQEQGHLMRHATMVR